MPLGGSCWQRGYLQPFFKIASSILPKLRDTGSSGSIVFSFTGLCICPNPKQPPFPFKLCP